MAATRKNCLLCFPRWKINVLRCKVEAQWRKKMGMGSLWHRRVCPSINKAGAGFQVEIQSQNLEEYKKVRARGCNSIASEGLLTVRTAKQNKQKTRLLFLLPRVSRCHPQGDFYHLRLFHDPCSSGRNTPPTLTTQPTVDLCGMHEMLNSIHPS